MGQYHKLVNLTAKQYLNPHNVGAMYKAWEQLSGGVPAALTALLAYNPGNAPADLGNHPLTGQWAGHHIMMVGDYAEKGDVKRFRGMPPVEKLYGLCNDEPKLEDFKDTQWTVWSSGVRQEMFRTASQNYKEALKYFKKTIKGYTNFPDIAGQLGGLLEDVLSVRFCGEFHTMVPVEPYAVKGDDHAHYMLPKNIPKQEREYYFRMLRIPEGMQYPDTLPNGRWPWDRAPNNLNTHNFTVAQADQGQTRVFANLDKKEFFDPAAFGEQPTVAGIMRASTSFGTPIMANDMVISSNGVEINTKTKIESGIGSASCLFALLLHPETRGGGDISPEIFPEIGRWRADRLVLTAEYGDAFPTTNEVKASFKNISGEMIKGAVSLASD